MSDCDFNNACEGPCSYCDTPLVDESQWRKLNVPRPKEEIAKYLVEAFQPNRNHLNPLSETPSVSFVASDGYLSIGFLTYGEILDKILEKYTIVSDDEI